MRIVSTSYSGTPACNDPYIWLRQISFYTGLLEELATRHEVHSIERISYEGEIRQNNVQYHFIDLKSERVLFPRRIHRLVKQLEPDIVLVNGFIFPLQIIQLRASLGKKPVIIVLHRAEKPFKGVKKYLQRAADSCVQAYFFTSAEFGLDWKQQGIINDRRKIHEIIPASSSFIVLDGIMAKTQLAITGDPVFLWVGRLDNNKDPLTVLKAMIAFIQSNPLARFYMIFQEDHLLPEVQEMVQHSQLGHAIKLVGKLPHNQLQNWYNAADFIISGSHYEGGGIAVSEAMSCGCIPIVTDIISFRKMTAGGECGFLYEAGNEKDLLQKLMMAVKAVREEERRKVIMQFRQELSFEAIGRKIDTVINYTICHSSIKEPVI